MTRGCDDLRAAPLAYAAACGFRFASIGLRLPSGVVFRTSLSGTQAVRTVHIVCLCSCERRLALAVTATEQ